MGIKPSTPVVIVAAPVTEEARVEVTVYQATGGIASEVGSRVDAMADVEDWSVVDARALITRLAEAESA